MADDIFGRQPGAVGEPPDGTSPPATSDPGPPGGARSRPRRTVVLGSVLAVGLVGAGLLGPTGWRIVQQKDATLAAPAQAAGLPRDDSDNARRTADYLSTAFAAGIALDRGIGAVYTDPADANRSVLLFGGTTLLWSPEHDLDTLLELVGDDSDAISDVTEVSAGAYGGVMKCGKTTAEGVNMAVCGWADHGSIAIALFPGRSIGESAMLLRDIRDDVQSRD